MNRAQLVTSHLHQSFIISLTTKQLYWESQGTILSSCTKFTLFNCFSSHIPKLGVISFVIKLVILLNHLQNSYLLNV